MRYNNDGMSKVLSKLNESQQMSVEIEPTVGETDTQEVKQCGACSGFYTGDPESCPVCGAPAKKNQVETVVNEAKKARSARRRKLQEDTTVVVNSGTDPEDEDAILTEESEEKLPKDVQVDLNEAMKMLSNGQCKKFNENYSAKLLKNGKLNILVESENGRTYSVVRKMNAVQRANFKLSESMKSQKMGRVATAAKLESTRTARTNLVALSEMKAVKVAALKLMERQGIRYDFAKFNSALNESIKTSHLRFKKKFEDISEDKQTGMVDYESSTPEEISSDVAEVIEDTGLDVITHAVEEVTPETTEVMVRVQDDPSIEVNLQDVAETISDVTDTPVAVVGPTPTEGDSSVADVVVILNPDDETIDELDTDDMETPVALSESLRSRRARRLHECDSLTAYNKDPEKLQEEDDDAKILDPEEDDDDIPKLSERKIARKGLRKIKESEDIDPEEDDEDVKIDAPVINEGSCGEDDDDRTIRIAEEEDDSEETKDLIDQVKKLEEKIRQSRSSR